jgi:hypothetical protein
MLEDLTIGSNFCQPTCWENDKCKMINDKWLQATARPGVTKANIEIEQEAAEATERRTPLSPVRLVKVRAGRRQGMGIGAEGRGEEQLEPRKVAEVASRSREELNHPDSESGEYTDEI